MARSGGRCDGRRHGADGAGALAGQEWVQVMAEQRSHQGDQGGVADERQRDQVRQQPLVEVGGQEHDQRRGVDAEHGEVERVAPACRQGAEGGPGGHDDHGAAPVEPTHEAGLVGGPACSQPVGGQAEEGAQEARHEGLWRDGHRGRPVLGRRVAQPASMVQACPPRCLDAPARTYYPGVPSVPGGFAQTRQGE